MLKKTLLVFFLAVLIQVIIASSITITGPKPNDKWKAGQKVQIRWKASSSSHSKKVNIAIASGPRMALVVNKVIARNVPASAGKYEWRIPKSFRAPRKYVIEVGPSDSDIAFAGYISILPSKTKKTKSSKTHVNHKATTRTSGHARHTSTTTQGHAKHTPKAKEEGHRATHSHDNTHGQAKHTSSHKSNSNEKGHRTFHAHHTTTTTHARHTSAPKTEQ